MQCEICNANDAHVLITQVINNEKQEYHICTSCAAKMYTDISFENLFQGFINSIINPSEFNFGGDVISEPHKTCVCGIKLENIKKIGKFGCANCYQTFEKEIKEIVKGIQGNISNVGKCPKKSASQIAAERKIEGLRTLLKEKVSLEEYEEAAKIRDEIKALAGGE